MFERWVAANRVAPKKINLIAHVVSNSLQAACDLARETTLRFSKGQDLTSPLRARSDSSLDLAGIDAICPAFLKRPDTLDVLVDWMVKINDCQTVSPQLPLFYYHIPGMFLFFLFPTWLTQWQA